MIHFVRKSLPFLFLIGMIVSCTSHNISETGIYGEWKMIGKADIAALIVDTNGNVNTNWDDYVQPVNSDKTMTFHPDGTVTSNGQMCSFYTESNQPSSGTFSLKDSTITTLQCYWFPSQGITYQSWFEIEGDTMTIMHQCIEICLSIYEKQ